MRPRFQYPGLYRALLILIQHESPDKVTLTVKFSSPRSILTHHTGLVTPASRTFDYDQVKHRMFRQTSHILVRDAMRNRYLYLQHMFSKLLLSFLQSSHAINLSQGCSYSRPIMRVSSERRASDICQREHIAAHTPVFYLQRVRKFGWLFKTGM